MQQREDSLPRRDWKFESCEERLAMSSQSLSDYWIDQTADDIVALAGPQVAAASTAPAWNDVAAVRDEFGLSGSRQTVVVIDSGIAYDHVALGGGLGKAYRVVGGWDFAENDANPYDDGPAGYHGTHVAGIIGAADDKHAGVAPDVDLIALRVFDDRGQSQFAWVESALRWVHQNRSAFDNPITTVNISLGTDWNGSGLPSWAAFEDELKQLADDGIFISAAAGNGFLVYGQPGLSYPAASQYVTSVASVDASGNLSRFSQRADRVLAAPGERITSTLPDHFYGGDGQKDDWGATSGTSMAAPWVAGASVLVREAMQNLGFAGITQATIYERLRTTADLVFDAATNASYRRINLQSALQSLVGVDESTSATDAKTVGTLTNSLTVSGTIGRVSDQDFFRFTAAQSGTATLTLGSTTQLAATWQAVGGVGQISGNQLTLNVQAGQTYVVGLAGGGESIGKYSVELKLAAANPGAGGGSTNSGGGTASPTNPVQLGTVEQLRRDGLDLRTADNWFEVTASRNGTLTVEALFQHSRGNIDVEVYDGQNRLVAASRSSSNAERIDLTTTSGSTYFVRIRGTNSGVDLRLTNLVAFAGNSVVVSGTSKSDTFHTDLGSRQFTVNGVSYSLGGATSVRFDGGSGFDAATIVGSAAAESATLRPGSLEVVGASANVSASGVEFARVVGNSLDRVILHDSAGRDTLSASVASTSLTGPGYQSIAAGYGSVSVLATSGSDTGTLIGSAGDDTLTVWAGVRDFQGGGTSIRAEGFQSVRFYGGAGTDRVNFYTAGSDSWLGGRRDTGWVYAPASAAPGYTVASGYTTELAAIESLLAHTRAKHRLHTELAALDYLFRKIGVS
jgi:hypothetical protein